MPEENTYFRRRSSHSLTSLSPNIQSSCQRQAKSQISQDEEEYSARNLGGQKHSAHNLGGQRKYSARNLVGQKNSAHNLGGQRKYFAHYLGGRKIVDVSRFYIRSGFLR